MSNIFLGSISVTKRQKNAAIEALNLLPQHQTVSMTGGGPLFTLNMSFGLYTPIPPNTNIILPPSENS